MKSWTKAALTASALVLTAMAAIPATATVYIGTSAVGPGSVHRSITTDGTIGALSSANIVDWTIEVMDGSGSTFIFQGPLSGNNSGVSSGGSQLSATATDLIFDFDFPTEDGAYLLFMASTAVGQGYCLQLNRCFDFDGPAEGFNLGTNGLQRSARSGAFSLGSVAAVSAVPEPSSWAMVILGFGMMGGAMRSRRQKIAVQRVCA